MSQVHEIPLPKGKKNSEDTFKLWIYPYKEIFTLIGVKNGKEQTNSISLDKEAAELLRRHLNEFLDK